LLKLLRNPSQIYPKAKAKLKTLVEQMDPQNISQSP